MTATRRRWIGVLAFGFVAAAAALAARAQVPHFPAYEKGSGVFATSKAPEACTSCHFKMTPVSGTGTGTNEEPERREIVVIGGGLSGLTAAWNLRDRDVVVLEKDADTGGKIKRADWQGIRYSMGPAYFVLPEDDTAALFKDLELKWVEVPEPSNAVVIDGKFVYNPWTAGVDELPFPKETREKLKKGFKEIAALAADIAVPARASDAKLLELDKVPAVEFFQQYGEEMQRIVNPYIRSCFAIEPEEVSALGAITFFACEFDKIYTFPGGLADITARLTEKLGPKVRTGAYVTEVSVDKDTSGVRVVYRDAASGKPRTIRASAAIVTIAQNAAKYIVKGLSEERRDLMSRVYHGGYAVAAIKTNKVVYDGSFDFWMLDGPVTDVLVADWVARGGKVDPKGAPARKAILNAYMPLGVAGRAELLSKSNDAIKERFIETLAPRLPGLKESLAEIEVFYYGHAMHVAYPGYITEISPKLSEPVEGKIFFAGVELDLPAIESAIWSGAEAARQVRRAVLDKRQD